MTIKSNDGNEVTPPRHPEGQSYAQVVSSTTKGQNMAKHAIECAETPAVFYKPARMSTVSMPRFQPAPTADGKAVKRGQTTAVFKPATDP